MRSPAAARPAVLEGRWLGGDGTQALAARDPASVLEGREEALAQLPAWIARHVRRYPFGAAIGFLSYELARFFETLPLVPSPSVPDLSFAYYPQVERLPRSQSVLVSTPHRHQAEIRADFDEPRFRESVEEIRQYIAAGDIYQANLTQQVIVRLGRLSAQSVYERFSSGGAAFRAFLKCPDYTVISNSPERFFRVANGRILASPIKGTIARGDDPVEDRRKVAALLSSAKDRAENTMIVDLLRNDLGRICRYASIRTRLCEVDSLPHLHHLVSHVEGVLRPQAGIAEILSALFPCGSVTGAPKIRAMEILAEIEKRPRGISMGAVGVIVGAPGTKQFEVDFNVAIRTLTIQDDVATFNVGGGIVYDSKPEAEFEEMLLKAAPLLDALGVRAVAETWAAGG